MNDYTLTTKFNTPLEFSFLGKAYLGMAETFSRSEKPEEAAKALETSVNILLSGLERFPKSPVLFYDLGRSYLKSLQVIGQDCDQLALHCIALQCFQAGLKIAPSDRLLLSEMARFYKYRSQFEQAEETIFRILAPELDSLEGIRDFRILLSLAKIYEDWGQSDKQAACVWKSLQIDKRDKMGNRMRCELEDRGEYDAPDSTWFFNC